MPNTTTINVRVDGQLKAQATETLAAIGLTVSDAVRMLLACVVTEKRLPDAIKMPNDETLAAMAEVDEMIRANRARFATEDDLPDGSEKNSGK